MDVVNFYVDIWIENKTTGKRRLYSKPGHPSLETSFRYCHVGEFIAIVSVFTTLKYFPNQPDLFRERILRYSKTLPWSSDSKIIFEYYSIAKTEQGFSSNMIAEFIVEPNLDTVLELPKSEGISHFIRSPHFTSPVNAGAAPGSYAPASSHKS